jgi:hypothetical protein
MGKEACEKGAHGGEDKGGPKMGEECTKMEGRNGEPRGKEEVSGGGEVAYALAGIQEG